MTPEKSQICDPPKAPEQVFSPLQGNFLLLQSTATDLESHVSLADGDHDLLNNETRQNKSAKL